MPGGPTSALPVRAMSEGLAHWSCPAGALGLHACIGVPTEKRPSKPKSQVGLVRSRAWLRMSKSMPASMYSSPLRVGPWKGTPKSCSPGAPSSAAGFGGPPPIWESDRVSLRITGSVTWNARSW